MGIIKRISTRKVLQAIVVTALLAMVLMAPLRALLGSGAAPKEPATPVVTATRQATASGGSETSADPTGEPTAEPTSEPARETRAVWVSRWDFKEHRDVQQIVDNAARAHMNVILFQVRGQADAMYRSDLEPWAADLSGTFGQDPGSDPLAELISAAHARGIEVQAWMNVYPAWMGDTPPPASVTPKPMYQEFNERYGNEWVQWQGSTPMELGGEGYLWANPAHPAVADRVVEVSKDLLRRYELDGLHLDYVRYAGPEISQDPVSNKAYAEAAAQNPGLSREDWQRDQVTRLVQRVHDEALPERRGARLTTSAWPVYQDHWGWYRQRDGYGTFYQDSERWSREGRVSAIMPMLYGVTIHDHLDRYETLARDYVQGSAPGGVVLGIGADYDDFSALADRIEATRQAGARGQAFFSYRALDEHGYWAALGDGPYQQTAVPNWP